MDRKILSRSSIKSLAGNAMHAPTVSSVIMHSLAMMQRLAPAVSVNELSLDPGINHITTDQAEEPDEEELLDLKREHHLLRGDGTQPVFW